MIVSQMRCGLGLFRHFLEVFASFQICSKVRRRPCQQFAPGHNNVALAELHHALVLLQLATMRLEIQTHLVHDSLHVLGSIAGSLEVFFVEVAFG